MLLWTFNIRKAEGTNPETGLAFHYDDGDAGFTGDVRVYSRWYELGIEISNIWI